MAWIGGVRVDVDMPVSRVKTPATKGRAMMHIGRGNSWLWSMLLLLVALRGQGADDLGIRSGWTTGAL